MKKWISFLLAAAIVLTVALPAGAASAPVFSDVSDASAAREIAVLQMIGVVAGTSAGRFSPNGTLTRAQFCKMAVVMLGRGSEEPLYRTRTIFPDVRGTHWARGYINLAVSIDLGVKTDGTGGTKLIRGMAGGTFQPDRAITYAEAVTILVRMLGYSDADAGMLWPKGYLDLAAKVGLTGGMSLNAGQALTRAQAAHIFVSLLTADQKGGSAFYNTLGTATQDVVVTDGNAKADDGTLGALGTSAGVYKTASGLVPASLVGSRGVLTVSDGKATAFVPTGIQKTVTVASAQAAWFKDADGNKYVITEPDKTPAYSPDRNATYTDVWMNLTPGMMLTVYFTSAGKVGGVFLNTGAADGAMVALSSGAGAFDAILDGASDYTIYRDGSKVSASEIAAYDVGTYDAVSRILSVSSAKLTGVYENVWPNQESPAKITVMGLELKVMPAAMDEVASFKIGDRITVLLTADHQVAGTVADSVVHAENAGVVTKSDGTTAEVKLLNGLTVSGANSSGTSLIGELVTAGSNGKGTLYVTKVGSFAAPGALSVSARTVGTVALSGNARLFDRAGRSAMKEVSWSDLTADTIPASKISYALVNPGGRIDALVFDNVTGDCYTYGNLKKGEPETGGEGDLSYKNNTIQVFNQANPGGTASVVCGYDFREGKPGGVAFAADGQSVVGIASLTAATGVKRSAFHTAADGVTTVALGTMVVRVSADVQCYNALTGKWFASLTDARAFSDNLSVYYDRTPAEGGKVRLVVAS